MPLWWPYRGNIAVISAFLTILHPLYPYQGAYRCYSADTNNQ